MKHFLLILLVSFFCSTASADEIVTVPTRFGSLKSNADGEMIFKGKKVVPRVMLGKYTGRVISTFKLGNTAVVLVAQPSGNACPGNFTFVTVTSNSATATLPFGTCYDDDEIKPVVEGNTIVFSMKRLEGKGNTKYTYRSGIVSEKVVDK